MDLEKKLTFISDNKGEAEVKQIALGDEVLIHDMKFRVTYFRENPIRLSLEPVPFQKQESDGNKIERQDGI